MNFAWETHNKDKPTKFCSQIKGKFLIFLIRCFIDAFSRVATGFAQAGKTTWTELLYLERLSSGWSNQMGRILTADQFVQCWSIWPVMKLLIIIFHFPDISLRTFHLAAISWEKSLMGNILGHSSNALDWRDTIYWLFFFLLITGMFCSLRFK